MSRRLFDGMIIEAQGFTSNGIASKSKNRTLNLERKTFRNSQPTGIIQYRFQDGSYFYR